MKKHDFLAFDIKQSMVTKRKMKKKTREKQITNKFI